MKKFYYVMAYFVIQYKKPEKSYFRPIFHKKMSYFCPIFSQKMSYNPIILMYPITWRPVWCIQI